MSWFSLSETQAEDHKVRIRFVPDTLIHEDPTPVLEVTIEEADHLEEIIEALAKFRNDFIVDLDVKDKELRLVGEMDYETVLSGGQVSLRRVAYSAGELLVIATSMQQKAQKEMQNYIGQSQKLRGIRNFVSDLIERAERKRDLSEKSTGAVEAQLSVLNRVLHRLDDA